MHQWADQSRGDNSLKLCLRSDILRLYYSNGFKALKFNKEDAMAWTTPVMVEICIGLEINGYLPPEF